MANRYNVNLSDDAYNDMAELSKKTHRRMSELVRLGLHLAHVAYTEVLQGNKVLIADAKGNILRELVLPK